MYVCPNHMHKAPLPTLYVYQCSQVSPNAQVRIRSHTYVAVHAYTCRNILYYYIILYILKVTIYVYI